MAYPIPNITGLTDLFSYVNSVSNGIWGYGILIAIFFIVFLNLSFAENTKAFSVASWITMLASIFLRLMGLIPTFVLFICIFLAIIGIIALKGTEKEFG